MRRGRSARAKYPHLIAGLGTMEHMFASRRGHLEGLVVLGIDPGLTRCGYAVLQAQSATKFLRCRSGCCVHRQAVRFLIVWLSCMKRLLRFCVNSRPMLSQSSKFFQANVRTAMSVGQASGIALALAARDGADVAQYTPSQMKNAIAGWGGANKEQVQRMVQVRLGLSVPPQPPDAADAAAIALCHIACAPFMALQNAALQERQSAI